MGERDDGQEPKMRWGGAGAWRGPLARLAPRGAHHLFLTALSVRPGSSLAIAVHLFPSILWAWGRAWGEVG
jgi:hypothetical protein